MIDQGIDIQVERGNWAKVHNCILEKLACIKLDGREAKCIFFLLRMTYGNQTKEHCISLSLWADGTSIDKRHVKPVIDKLIERNIVYRLEGKRGRGNTAIYGFNKYFEQWDSEKKVPRTAPIKKVPSTVPIQKEKVPSTVPEKVPSTVPIKERSYNSSLPADSKSETKRVNRDEDSNDAMALVRESYQVVCKIGPPMSTDAGRANLITASEMIELFGFKECLRGLAILKERNNAMVLKNSRNGIRAPLPYLRTILENEHEEKQAAPATVLDFVFEEQVA